MVDCPQFVVHDCSQYVSQILSVCYFKVTIYQRYKIALTSLSLKDEMRQSKEIVAPVSASILSSDDLSSSKEGELNLKKNLNYTKLLVTYFTSGLLLFSGKSLTQIITLFSEKCVGADLCENAVNYI